MECGGSGNLHFRDSCACAYTHTHRHTHTHTPTRNSPTPGCTSGCVKEMKLTTPHQPWLSLSSLNRSWYASTLILLPIVDASAGWFPGWVFAFSVRCLNSPALWSLGFFRFSAHLRPLSPFAAATTTAPSTCCVSLMSWMQRTVTCFNKSWSSKTPRAPSMKAPQPQLARPSSRRSKTFVNLPHYEEEGGGKRAVLVAMVPGKRAGKQEC